MNVSAYIISNIKQQKIVNVFSRTLKPSKLSEVTVGTNCISRRNIHKRTPPLRNIINDKYINRSQIETSWGEQIGKPDYLEGNPSPNVYYQPAFSHRVSFYGHEFLE